jgi:HSP20 family molecular chaperone IbpA
MTQQTAQKDVATSQTGDVHAAKRETDAALRPPVDIWEDGESITLQLDMPGVSAERLSVRADRDNLVIEGDAQIEMPDGIEALYADIRSTRYRRSFNLSHDLETDKVDAALKNGVLTVRIPKREEVRARKIPVRTA